MMPASYTFPSNHPVLSILQPTHYPLPSVKYILYIQYLLYSTYYTYYQAQVIQDGGVLLN